MALVYGHDKADDVLTLRKHEGDIYLYLHRRN